jgi:hypothetical protein
MSSEFIEFIHPELNKEVQAIGGRYVLTQESVLPFDGREILYFSGYAVIDTSCCGTGGCSYALVPGFVLEWKYKTSAEGNSVSRIERITNPDIRKRVIKLIVERENVSQVIFQ